MKAAQRNGFRSGLKLDGVAATEGDEEEFTVVSFKI
jgi:hypothetical protein